MKIYHFDMNRKIAEIAAAAMKSEGLTAETMRKAPRDKRSRVILRARQEGNKWGITTHDLAAYLNVSPETISINSNH